MPHQSPEARREYNRKYYASWIESNAERRREKQREQYAADLENNRRKAADKQRRWAATNPEKVWRNRNPDKYLEMMRGNRNDHRREVERSSKARHRDKQAATCAKRKASKLRATPLWANLSTITAKYEDAAMLTSETGIKHHVDHIVPLINPLVCGLHVDWNLRVIPATENMKKGNTLLSGLELAHERKVA